MKQIIVNKASINSAFVKSSIKMNDSVIYLTDLNNILLHSNCKLLISVK